MRWLLHGKINPAVDEALRRHGHDARRPVDVSLTDESAAAEVFQAAHKNQLDLMTVDQKVATALYEEPAVFERSIVYLHVGQGEVEQDDAIDRLFKRYKRLTPGRLYTVTDSRVKVRQLPQQKLGG